MAAKESPGGMCHLLARGIEQYIEGTLAPGGAAAQVPEQLVKFTDEATWEADAGIGADYAR